MADAGAARVFVSHHHSPDEDAFTKRLVTDLEAAGANVWVDYRGITSEDFVKKIGEGMKGRQWLVLVMSPQSVTSPWVEREVNAALSEVTAKRMLGVVPIVMTPTDEQDIPILWRPLLRYDATRAYAPARDGLLHALGLRAAALGATPQLAPTIPAAARYPVPARLGSLGYQGINLTGAPAYLPPVITIPTGPFLMGSDKAHDPDTLDDETPQYWVEVDTFQIAKYPVTVAEYALAVRAGAVREPPADLWDAGVTWVTQQQHPDHPVVCVSWQDAMAYIAWLSKATGQRGWRLPAEAEWEKAARWDSRANASRIYPWGDAFDQARCNTDESGIRATSPVGSYPASRSGSSPFGVEEMAGNVWEWVSSLYKPYPYIKIDGREDQKSIKSRTLRGGSWNGIARYARAACRNDAGPDDFDYYFGFRLALSPDGS